MLNLPYKHPAVRYFSGEWSKGQDGREERTYFQFCVLWTSAPSLYSSGQRDRNSLCYWPEGQRLEYIEIWNLIKLEVRAAPRLSF